MQGCIIRTCPGSDFSIFNEYLTVYFSAGDPGNIFVPEGKYLIFCGCSCRQFGGTGDPEYADAGVISGYHFL